jgi:hypothetical protein
MKAMEHRYKDVRDQAKDWHSVPVDGGLEPHKALDWVETNISGEWTWKSVRDAEVRAASRCSSGMPLVNPRR